jgi:hypothetical protein
MPEPRVGRTDRKEREEEVMAPSLKCLLLPKATGVEEMLENMDKGQAKDIRNLIGVIE